ncbi:Cytochrome b5 isoform A (AtCb5-A) (Cytochrome b5 isoform D) (AtCb5-D) [Durusdinium trenchii]|uniref:Cytochrome b5 isoform A (AtCb5-A) (Cytochrome b5 isoform D) (AtCb5-D) n=1 Tax=Durusdinium trenchii TaxID=1381693 RepID=A0ABP0JEW3_9DINO
MATVAPAASRVVTKEELGKRCGQEDCWVALHGAVYDLTKFMENHPGGKHAILNVAGRDATEDFSSAGHGTHHRNVLSKVFVGTLEGFAPRQSSSETRRASPASMQRTVAHRNPSLDYYGSSQPSTREDDCCRIS